MDEIDRIVDEVQRSFDGDPWHGPSIKRVLEGVTLTEAIRRPLPAHTIWELVLHVTVWVEEVARRLQCSVPAEPPEGDWPPLGEIGDSAWDTTMRRLAAAHAALVEAIRRFPESRLDEIVGEGERVAAIGNGVTFSVMLHGVAQHTAYHAGQMALLRKATDDVPDEPR